MITIENKEYKADLYLRLSREKLEKFEGNAVNTYDYNEFDDKEKESGSITNQRAFLTRLVLE